MKELEIFYLTGCPYCVNARKAVDALIREEPAYADIPIRWIEESRERELADSRDYYYVPTIYLDGEKLYEASPRHDYETIKSRIRDAFERSLRG